MSSSRLCDIVTTSKDDSHLCLEFWEDSAAPPVTLTWRQFSNITTRLTNDLKRCLPTHSAVAVINSSSHHVIVPLLHSILLSDCSFCPIMPIHFLEIISLMKTDLFGILIINDVFTNSSFPGFKKCLDWSHESISLFVRSDENCLKLFPKVAYHIFTSGSTGKPKLVRVPHDCIRPNIEDFVGRFPLESGTDGVITCAPITFDPFIVEMYVALASQARLIIPSTNVRSHSSEFVTVILKSRVSILQCTPSFFLGLGISHTKRLLSSKSPLHWIIFGGEPSPPLSTLQNLQDAGNETQFFSVYGVTELSCWSTIGKIKNTEFPSIGKPMLDTVVNLSNDGEIIISRTKTFCEIDGYNHEFYLTGDLGEIDEDNDLLFLGRKDRIVKRWGLKINLSLIESCITNLPFIKHCCCGFDVNTDILTVKISSFSSKQEETIQKEVLLQLGAAYVPNRVLFVDKIPISLHGKAILQPLCVKKSIADLWKLFLGHEPMYGNSNWIQEGGTSLGALGLSATIEDALSLSKAFVLDALVTLSFDGVVATIKNEIENCNYFKQEQKTSSKFLLHNEHRYIRKRKINISSDVDTESSPKLQVSTVCVCQNDVKLIKTDSCSKNDSIVENSLLILPKISTKWKSNLGKCVDSSALIIPGDNIFPEDCLFIGSHSRRFVSLRVDDGSIIWSTEFPDRIEASAAVSSCSYRVLIGCYDGCLYVINRQSGIIDWIYYTKGQMKTTPCVSQSRAYFGSHDGCVHAVNICCNTSLWRRDLDSSGIVSSPTLHTSDLFVATLKGSVVSLSSEDGTVNWRTTVNKPVFSSLICTGSILIVGCVDKNVYGLNKNNGDCVWEFPTKAPIFSSPTCVPKQCNILIGSHDGNVYSINSSTGIGKNLCTRDKAVYSSPTCIQHKDGLFVVCADVEGNVFVADYYSGKTLCEHRLPAEVFSSPVLSGNSVIIGCRDDNIYSLLLT